MDETPQIYWFKYLAQLNDHMEMADRIDSIVNAEDGQFIEAVAQHGMKQLEPLLKNTEPASRERFREALFNGQKQKARSYPSVIANQTLVLMCATIDLYLQDSMRAILNVDKSTVYTLSNEKDITVHEVISMSDGMESITHIKNKILNRFDHEGIRDKYKDLKRCELKIDEALARNGLNKETLFDAYDVRHSIVHKGSQPFKKSDELHEYHAFFMQFISSFAETCKKDKGILSDLDMPLEKAKKS